MIIRAAWPVDVANLFSFPPVACWQRGRGGHPPPQLAILGGRKNEKGEPIPCRILKVGGKKRIRKNIVTSAKKRCVYRLINRLNARIGDKVIY